MRFDIGVSDHKAVRNLSEILGGMISASKERIEKFGVDSTLEVELAEAMVRRWPGIKELL